MSFYLGNDLSGKEILHITSGTHTEAELKSGALSDTVFHSNSSYLSYDISPVTYNAKYKQAWMYGTTFGYFRDFITTLGTLYSSDTLIFLNSSKQIMPKYTNWYKYNYGYDGYWFRDGEYLPRSSGTYGIFQIDDGRRKAADFDATANAATPAYIIRLKTVPSFSTTGSGLSFGNGDITIGGSSLTAFKYIYNGTLNNHPSSIQIGNGQQLIDASQISGELSLISTGSSTTLLKGGTPIITSNGGFGTPLNVVNETFNQQYFMYTAASFHVGQLISVRDSFSNTTTFLTYTDGKVVVKYGGAPYIEIVCVNNKLQITCYTTYNRRDYKLMTLTLTITYYSQ